MNRFLTFAILVAGSSLSAFAAEPKTELLWPSGTPDAKGTEAKDKPTLIIYLPEKEKANGGAIVICPGGGYGGLAMDHEGHQIARWLNDNGIAGFICDYRHRGKGYGHPAPLEDAQRAIRIVRSRAKEFNVDPAKVGILGFSAGGHLTSSAVTHFDKGKTDSKDPIDQVSCRPDFGVLCYPVIAFNEKFTHVGSQHNLLGKDAPEELVKTMSSEKQVTAETPPCFLWHTYEDTGVPPENSIVFYLACIKNKVPAELHVYEKGRHGVGLGKSIAGTENWPTECIAWMKNHGFAK
ncbi:MAG: alpha/beta hydrolase [Pirellulaceae bacterium]|nr:alpha/beta hydrolase [Pirellulaceae bacterium]